MECRKCILEMLLTDVRVTICRGNACMAEHLLDDAQACVIF